MTMVPLSLFRGLVFSLFVFLLLLNLCYAADHDDVQTSDQVISFSGNKGAVENGVKEEDEKFKYLHHHKPIFKFLPHPKPIYKKPFKKPFHPSVPVVKKPLPPVHDHDDEQSLFHYYKKKPPIPKFKKPVPIFKKPFPKHIPAYKKKPFPPPISVPVHP